MHILITEELKLTGIRILVSNGIHLSMIIICWIYLSGDLVLIIDGMLEMSNSSSIPLSLSCGLTYENAPSEF